MHNIYHCVDAFNELLNIEYNLILGRKGKSVELHISFDKKDCFHLMGLQYLKDIADLKSDRGKIFDAILNREIDVKYIEASSYYSKIRDRVHLLPYLEYVFDSNKTIFKFNEREVPYSKIQADYLMQNTVIDRDVFLFLAKENNAENSFFADPFFQKIGWITV